MTVRIDRLNYDEFATLQAVRIGRGTELATVVPAGLFVPAPTSETKSFPSIGKDCKTHFREALVGGLRSGVCLRIRRRTRANGRSRKTCHRVVGMQKLD